MRIRRFRIPKGTNERDRGYLVDGIEGAVSVAIVEVQTFVPTEVWRPGKLAVRVPVVSQSNELEQSSKLLVVARSDPQSLVWGTLIIIPRTAIYAPFVAETLYITYMGGTFLATSLRARTSPYSLCQSC